MSSHQHFLLLSNNNFYMFLDYIDMLDIIIFFYMLLIYHKFFLNCLNISNQLKSRWRVWGWGWFFIMISIIHLRSMEWKGFTWFFWNGMLRIFRGRIFEGIWIMAKWCILWRILQKYSRNRNLVVDEQRWRCVVFDVDFDGNSVCFAYVHHPFLGKMLGIFSQINQIIDLDYFDNNIVFYVVVVLVFIIMVHIYHNVIFFMDLLMLNMH